MWFGATIIAVLVGGRHPFLSGKRLFFCFSVEQRQTVEVSGLHTLPGLPSEATAVAGLMLCSKLKSKFEFFFCLVRYTAKRPHVAQRSARFHQVRVSKVAYPPGRPA